MINTGRLHNLAINEHGFVFDPSTGYSYNANETGLIIINLMRQNKSEEEIINTLANEYDADADTISRDYDFFLRQLTQFGIVSNQ